MDELKVLGILRDTTIIITTHRLSTLRFCHEYFLLNEHLWSFESGGVYQALNEKGKCL